MLPFRYTRSFGELPPRMQPALARLLEARQYADQTCADRWEFAVELDSLADMGLNLNDFRWLVRTQLIEHQREITNECDNGRAFRPTGDLMFPEGTCCVLTAKGVDVASDLCERGSREGPSLGLAEDRPAIGEAVESIVSPSNTEPSVIALATRPHWDADRRLLRFNGMLIKQFRWCAQNQEAVLSAFEEEGWSSRIDDPLPPHPAQDPKRRLSDTIKCLNRKQENSIVHFRGDGTGEGVVWELADYR